MSIIWQPQLSGEAQRWRAVAERVAHEKFAPPAEEIDREQRYPYENVRALVELGLAGLFIPKAYGGQGADLSTTAAVEAIAEGCASTAAILCIYQQSSGSTAISAFSKFTRGPRRLYVSCSREPGPSKRRQCESSRRLDYWFPALARRAKPGSLGRNDGH